MSHPALTRLRALRYFAVMPSLAPPLSDWLLLEDSMTQRFEQQGKQVTVTLVNEGYIGRDALTDEAALLPDEPRYWLREIILNADGEPWLAGRTVAPESTLCGPELALQQLGQIPDVTLKQLNSREQQTLVDNLTRWRVQPNGTEGYRTAEVTLGGVDTHELSSRTMEARNVPGLYFIGEVMDVTGWLGGCNFQWAWSSDWACAQALADVRGQ